MNPTITKAKTTNTRLANDARQAVWALRFEGVAIPKAVWEASNDLLAALELWFQRPTLSAPDREV